MFNLFVVLANESVKFEKGNLGALGDIDIADIITFGVRALLIVGGILALIYLLLGGLAWITSGGNKESVDKARDKIQAAVVGLIVIVVAVALVVLMEKVLNIGLGISADIVFPTLLNQPFPR